MTQVQQLLRQLAKFRSPRMKCKLENLMQHHRVFGLCKFLLTTSTIFFFPQTMSGYAISKKSPRQSSNFFLFKKLLDQVKDPINGYSKIFVKIRF